MNKNIYMSLQSLPNVILNENLFSKSLYTKMQTESIEALQLLRKNRVLELDHGLCNHLSFLMSQASDLKYFGMEVSEKLCNEANKKHKKYIDDCQALFQVYDGLNVPYVHNIFDRILSVNRIYYCEDPLAYFNEIFRCLKPGGVSVVSFSDVTFLEQLPVLENKDIYSFYDREMLTSILNKSEFVMFTIEEKKERIKTKSGSWEDESYFIITLRKKEKSRYLR